VPVHEKARAEQLIQEVRALVKSASADVARLRKLTDDLRQLAAGLAQGAPAASGAAGSPPPQGEPAHDVVDAEYTRT